MGTKVDCKSYLPGYYSMKDLNEDCSSSSSWPLFYGDNGITNGQYYNGFMPRNSIDDYPGYEKDALKQKMLEHEAVFKNQVYELHRLYRIQRDMMKEVKRKDVSTRVSVDPSSSSSVPGSQLHTEDPRKWHMAGFPQLNSGYVRHTSISPISCTKGNNNTQAGWSSFQNGCSSSKDYEALDSRPLKVRKKLFDLQLPADEYIDTEEREKGNQKSGPESSMKLYTGGHDGVTDWRFDASASASCSRNSMMLADLNEPSQIKEAMAPSSVDFFGKTSINGVTKGIYQSAKSKTSGLDVGGETMFAHDNFLGNSSIQSKVNEREHRFHLYESGSSKSNIAVSQVHRQEKFPPPSHPGQGILYPVHHSPAMNPTSYSREDHWREGSQFSDINLDRSNNSHLVPVEVSQAPGSFPFFNSHSHSVSLWKPNSFSRNFFESKPLNSTAVPDRCLPISSRGWDLFGGKRMINSSNPGSASEATAIPNNGFYNGSSSASKELHFHLPPAGIDNRNFGRGDNVAFDRFTNHGFGKFPMEPKPVVDINLNEVLPKNSSAHEKVVLQDLNLIDRKSETEAHPSALPWLKPKPAHGNEASSDRLNCKNETVRDFNQQFTPEDTLVSNDREIMGNKEIVETQNVQKILGFPIFALKNESSSLASTSACFEGPRVGKNVNSKRRSVIIDINLECESGDQVDAAAEELIAVKEKHSNIIDLNSCLSDSEDPSALSYESKPCRGKPPFEIDLEAPPLLESEEDTTPVEENTTKEVSLQLVENKNEQPQDDVLINAAKMLVDFSDCPQILANDEIAPPTMESFLFFAEAITSCANELESDIDEFEAMTLQLAEIKEEDYMPVSFIPELQKMEDSGKSTVVTRPRRGQARRGRQRRDFQRDILPGLVSLSRHEVTEDLQIFGGMMKATGHSWNSGLTRRNGARGGAGRGRRKAVVVETVVAYPICAPPPLVQQLNNSIEAGLEERRLTGWGKTTRRPRRQRCPAGNAPSGTVALT